MWIGLLLRALARNIVTYEECDGIVARKNAMVVVANEVSQGEMGNSLGEQSGQQDHCLLQRFSVWI